MRISDWSSDVCSSDLLTANGRTLDHSHQQQQNRRPHADLGIGRQQAHDEGRHGHHENAQGEHFLAAQQVTERSEEHTYELQSLTRISYAVLCLKKKQAEADSKDASKKQTTHEI